MININGVMDFMYHDVGIISTESLFYVKKGTMDMLAVDKIPRVFHQNPPSNEAPLPAI